jgi:hypothetical protein
MTKSDGARFAAVLSANSQFDVGTDSPSILHGHPYESSHSFGVKNLKRVVCKNTPINVRRKEPARIIPA